MKEKFEIYKVKETSTTSHELGKVHFQSTEKIKNLRIDVSNIEDYSFGYLNAFIGLRIFRGLNTKVILKDSQELLKNTINQVFLNARKQKKRFT